MDKKESLAIDYLRFPLTLLVVILHAYTATQNVTWLKTEHPGYDFVTCNFSLLWGNVAVPFFFFLSGYLFFIHYSNKRNYYLSKWKKRIYTLLLPYLIWNFLTLILYYILQNNVFTASYFAGFYGSISEYTWKDFLQAFWAVGGYNGGDSTPILSPYWYIRNLILLCLLTPVIYKLNIYIKYFWLIPLGLVWISVPCMAFNLCSIFWFSTGAYFSIHRIELYAFFKKSIRLKIGLWLFLWIMYNISYFLEFNKMVSVLVSRMFIIGTIGLLFIWSYHSIANKKSINKKLSASSFFIFTIHYPIILAIRKVTVKFLPGMADITSILLWVISIVITVIFCYGVYLFMDKFFPRLLLFLCGNHGYQKERK